MTGEHDAVVRRVEVGQEPRPLGNLFSGKNDPARRKSGVDGADDVVEVLERLGEAGDGDGNVLDFQ
jgi:hypothetical protein